VSLARAELPRTQPELRLGGSQLLSGRRPVAVIDLTNDSRSATSPTSCSSYSPRTPSSHLRRSPTAPRWSTRRRSTTRRGSRRPWRSASRAEQNLAQRNFRQAAIDAVNGQTLLFHVTPRKGLALYADLATGARAIPAGRAEGRRGARGVRADLPARPAADARRAAVPAGGGADLRDRQRRSIPASAPSRCAGRPGVIDGEDVGEAPGEFQGLDRPPRGLVDRPLAREDRRDGGDGHGRAAGPVR